ncbi:hypothetical protein AK830_g29 [Neonectria ditissima]|uniref:Uncharacterized protein n=1 Tax=Neonectria ditissima TaxID=78410 RepID=A0A0P7BQG8_9HYPO|nr:hypothetical protein AK830_g29 [Neonectria ditissima]
MASIPFARSAHNDCSIVAEVEFIREPSGPVTGKKSVSGFRESRLFFSADVKTGQILFTAAIQNYGDALLLGREMAMDATANPPRKELALPDSNSRVEETAPSSAEDRSTEMADFQSFIDTLPPVQSWSSSTISSLKAAVNNKYPEAPWNEESEWTRKTIDAILSTNQAGTGKD